MEPLVSEIFRGGELVLAGCVATVLFTSHSAITRFSGFRVVEVHGTAPSRARLAGGVLFQLGVAVYVGYFGAGIGILITVVMFYHQLS